MVSNSLTLLNISSLQGGDQLGVNLLDTADTASTILEWKQSIASKPIPIDFKLKEFPTLISDLNLRSQLNVALALYLNIPTQNIVSVNSSSVFNV